MPAGVQLFNNSRTLQITNEDKPYVLLKSIKITSADSWIYYTRGMKAISSRRLFNFQKRIGEYGDLLFAIHTEGWDARCTVDLSGNLCMWHDLSIQSGQYIEVYVFARVTPNWQGKSGLQLFKPNYGLIFDSSWHILNITDVIEIPAGKPAYSPSVGFTPYQISTAYTDSKYAVAQSTHRQMASEYLNDGQENTGEVMGYHFQVCAWMKGSTVTLTGVPVGIDLTGGWERYPYIYNNTGTTLLYLIDTTNYPVPYDLEA
ncbi:MULTISPECIES: hypothetical protein [unclassified Brenneria]|uniref:hypothetical protein n=1 Tax=unclassified Brenneria TaxID=2634434 RepID=UPI0015540A1A|nr:hypothetical protein [Brenneria sp. hezel4-2-4]MEE3649450.1 hypothetical protein [Brenneria sp. HEZEL_4_2_4]NPC99405.1 hypothetical protein [Brenneria sp. hezel4-2-4]